MWQKEEAINCCHQIPEEAVDQNLSDCKRPAVRLSGSRHHRLRFQSVQYSAQQAQKVSMVEFQDALFLTHKHEKR